MRKLFIFVAFIALCLTVNGNSSSVTKANQLLSPVTITQNADLDFTIVNKTGYDIKGLYVGPSGTGDWTKDDEVLHGKVFKNGASIDIEFHPRATAEKWDIMVAWTGDYENEEWLDLDLTEINKVTLVYDRNKDVTSAIIE